MINAIRQGEFVTKLYLTEHQRMMVKFFDAYTLMREAKVAEP
jgi:hypothetical protein